MPATSISRFAMQHPADFAGFEQALADSRIDARRLIAVWCKTEGNGLGNDFTRPYAEAELRRLLSLHGRDGDDLQIIVSGGCEGVVSPHLLALWFEATSEREAHGLVAGTSFAPITDHGGAGHIDVTARQVETACRSARLAKPDDVHLVMVRAPARDATPAHGAAVRRAVCAGVAAALGTHAPCAFAVSRSDAKTQSVVVLGNASDGGPCRIAHAPLADALDTPAMARGLAALGLSAEPQLDEHASARIVAAIAKGDAPGDRHVRGLRHTMLDDDLAAHRQIRSLYGGLIAGLIGHGGIFVSAGAEGLAAGGFVSFIAETQGAKQVRT